MWLYRWCERVVGPVGEEEVASTASAVAAALLGGGGGDEVAAQLYDLLGDAAFEQLHSLMENRWGVTFMVSEGGGLSGGRGWEIPSQIKPNPMQKSEEESLADVGEEEVERGQARCRRGRRNVGAGVARMGDARGGVLQADGAMGVGCWRRVPVSCRTLETRPLTLPTRPFISPAAGSR